MLLRVFSQIKRLKRNNANQLFCHLKRILLYLIRIFAREVHRGKVLRIAFPYCLPSLHYNHNGYNQIVMKCVCWFRIEMLIEFDYQPNNAPISFLTVSVIILIYILKKMRKSEVVNLIFIFLYKKISKSKSKLLKIKNKIILVIFSFI